ncbi:MAG TPA: EAL domain-containing protein [Polyangiaceae bacterium]|jgi:EAL domain-containing protein (putative c-di-GMP-specific phosphodiesterase class I)
MSLPPNPTDRAVSRETISISATTAPPHATAAGKRSVLIVDDEAAICRALDRVLRAAGFAVTTADDPLQALEAIMQHPFDVVLSDVMMPRMSGVDLLRVLRTYDLDVPVILMTGNPTVETAVEAVQLGALQYLPKPTPNEVIVEAVERASRLHQIAVMKRQAMQLLAQAEADAGNRASLAASFDRMLETMWMAFQPIVDRESRIFGYEALLRSNESSLPHPGAVLDAADKLERHQQLGRRVRALSAEAFARAPAGAALFVNLHVRDLLDPELYETDSPLGRIADRVVLEITERAAMETVKDIGARIAVLRYQGFRIAVDDLGAGYAGLASFAALEPDIVKLDMSLVRNAHESPVRRQLVQSMSTLCKAMNIQVVAEGVETAEEHACMLEAGCDLLQGYWFAKPGPPFPVVRT